MKCKRLLSFALSLMLILGSVTSYASNGINDIPNDVVLENPDIQPLTKSAGGSPSSSSTAGVAVKKLQSGTLNSGINWSLTGSGMLTISGTGNMDSFSQSEAPWMDSKDSIRFIYINDGITSIGDRAFMDLTKAKSAYIPDTVVTIGDSAFERCGDLKEINLPANLKTIGEGAFKYCTSIKTLDLPQSVTTIGNDAFSNLDSLKSFSVQQENKYYKAVDGVLFNFNLTELISYPDGIEKAKYTVPSGVTTIGRYAFDDCDIKEITLPDTLKTISDGAFYECSNIEKIDIPASVTSISQSALLYGMSSLKEINVSEDNQWYSSYRGVLYNKDKSKLIRFPQACDTAISKNGKYDMPETVKTIGQEAFLEVTTVVNMEIFGILEKIEMAAFMNFDSLTEIKFKGTKENWEQVEKDILNDRLDEVEIKFTRGKPEEEAFDAKVGKTYYLKNFVDLKGNEHLIDTLVVSSSNPDVATVDKANGEPKMVAISEGTAKITAIVIKDGTTYAAEVTVIVSSDAEDKKSGTFNLIEGDIFDLTENMDVPGEFLDSLVWNTSNPAVATVDNGLVTAISKGSAVVIATVNSTGTMPYSIRCEITVTPKYTDESYFKFSNGTITKYTGPDAEVKIPEKIGGVKVTAIGDNAFYNCNHVTKVEFPDTITRIGTYSFAYCQSLSNITLNEGITSIGSDAFSYCTSLIKIKIPSTVSANSGTYWFWGATRLNTVEFAKGTTNIGQGVRGAQIKNVIIPSSVTTINNYAFYSCPNLSTISLPDTVTSVGSYAFSGCSSLKSATLGTNTNTLGSGAFYNCYNLKSVNLGTKLTSISSYTFYYCSNLTDITIPNTVTSVGTEAFGYCTNLKTVTGGEGVKTIGDYAFYSCSKLESITLSDVLIGIGYCSFGYSGIKSVTIPGSVNTVGSNAFSYCSKLENINLGNGITVIGQNAFESTGITSIVIPDTVNKISSYAFRGCKNLTDVTLGNGVKTINSYAFYYCTNLKNITISNGVTSIGDYAFSYTAVTSLIIPDSVTYLGYNVFSGCSFLTDVTIGMGINSITSSLFYGCTSIKNITLSEGIKSIGSYAFSGCKYLKKITIPDSVTSIGSYAFQNCTELSDVDLGEGITSIGSYAFYGCNSLRTINIPDSVKSISSYAFSNCRYLNNVNFGEGIENIGSYSFYYCTALTSVTIPDSVKTIGGRAFYNCYNLKNLNLGEGIETISAYSFYNCYRLKNLVIPASVTYVDDYAFAYCSDIEDVQVGNPNCTFGYNVFYGCNKLQASAEVTGTYKALSEEIVGYFPMELSYDIKKTSLASSKEILINLPNGSYIVPGSMEIDGEIFTNYTELENEQWGYNKLTIYPEKDSGVITFCIKPTTYGRLSTNATISVKSLGRTINKLIGTVYISMPEITISSSNTTGKADVIVEGMAIPNKSIKLYVDGVYQKTVTSKLNGSYKTIVSINKPRNYQEYTIGAEIVNDSGETVKAETTVKYIANTPNLEGLTMYYGKNGYSKTAYDLYNPSLSYWDNSTRPLIRWGDYMTGSGRGYGYYFAVDVSQRDDVDRVYVVSTKDNKKEYLEAKWNIYTQRYETSGYFANDCEYIPGVLTVEYSKKFDGTLLSLLVINTYLDFAEDAFIPSVTDYTSESYSAEVTVGDSLKDVFGSYFNLSVEETDRDYTSISDSELYPQEDNYYSYSHTEYGKKYVVGFDLTDANNTVIYMHNLTDNKQTTYTMSFTSVDEEGNQINLDINNILDSVDELAGRVLNVYNINIDTEKLKDDLAMANLDSDELNLALERIEDLTNKKQMFILTSIVLSVSSMEGINVPYDILMLMIGSLYSDIEYFKDLRLLNMYKIGSECKIRWLIDPSGYVYEGVTANRLDGVTVTMYTISSEYVEENGDEIIVTDESKAVVWDAFEYEQINPLVTGEDGEYKWDINEIVCKIKYEKDGYETAYSDWMKVPPPRLDENVGLVSKAAPKVQSVNLTADYMVLTFDKYMIPETVKNVQIGDAEYNIEYDETQTDVDGNVFANEFKFKFKKPLLDGTDYKVSVSGAKSYADVLAEDYENTHKTPGEPLPKELILNNVNVDLNKITFKYYNNLSDDIAFKAVCAIYDDYDNLVDIMTCPVDKLKTGAEFNGEFTFNKEWSKYKIYTWSIDNRLKPLLKTYDGINNQ